jgi:hypothetical protein
MLPWRRTSVSTSMQGGHGVKTKVFVNNKHKGDDAVDISTEIHRAVSDIAKRRRNVVVSGLPEHGDDDDVSRKQDRQSFLLLCEEHLLMKPLVIDCRRLGKPVESGNESTGIKPRRLLVRLRSETCAADILTAAKRLRACEQSDIARKLYINPDLSPAESKFAYEKRQKRRELLHSATQSTNMKSVSDGTTATEGDDSALLVLADENIGTSTQSFQHK